MWPHSACGLAESLLSTWTWSLWHPWTLDLSPALSMGFVVSITHIDANLTHLPVVAANLAFILPMPLPKSDAVWGHCKYFSLKETNLTLISSWYDNWSLVHRPWPWLEGPDRIFKVTVFLPLLFSHHFFNCANTFIAPLNSGQLSIFGTLKGLIISPLLFRGTSVNLWVDYNLTRM